jgi:hypothetical protein
VTDKATTETAMTETDEDSAVNQMMRTLKANIVNMGGGRNGPDLSRQQALTVATMAVRLGLDPTLQHLMFMGNKVYITLPGLLAMANNHPEYDGMHFRPCTKQEREDFYHPREDPSDEHLWVAMVYRKDRGHPSIGYGRAAVASVKLGVRASSSNRFSPADQWSQEMAQARARARALRGAFANSALPASYEEVQAEVDMERYEKKYDPDKPSAVEPYAPATQEPELAEIIEDHEEPAPEQASILDS